VALLAAPTRSSAQTLSLGSAANYGVFEVSGAKGTLDITGAKAINGNVALGQGTTFTMTGGTINGTVYQDTSVTSTTTGGTVTGGITQGFSLSTASQNAISAAQAAGGLPTTNNLGSINLTGGTQTLSGAPNQTLNVISVSNGINVTGGTFTISGNANQWFVFNVSNGMTINGGQGFLLSGGVTANHILFNVLSGAVNITGGSDTVNGTILDLNGPIKFTNGTVNGALISEGNISITGSGATLNAAPLTALAPELPTILMPAFTCLLVLGKAGVNRLKRQHTPSAVSGSS
jgi:hypothetical protein